MGNWRTISENGKVIVTFEEKNDNEKLDSVTIRMCIDNIGIVSFSSEAAFYIDLFCNKGLVR